MTSVLSSPVRPHTRRTPQVATTRNAPITAIVLSASRRRLGCVDVAPFTSLVLRKQKGSAVVHRRDALLSTQSSRPARPAIRTAQHNCVFANRLSRPSPTAPTQPLRAHEPRPTRTPPAVESLCSFLTTPHSPSSISVAHPSLSPSSPACPAACRRYGPLSQTVECSPYPRLLTRAHALIHKHTPPHTRTHATPGLLQASHTLLNTCHFVPHTPLPPPPSALSRGAVVRHPAPASRPPSPSPPSPCPSRSLSACQCVRACIVLIASAV